MFEPAVPGGFCLRVVRTTLTRCGCPATLQAFRPTVGGNVTCFA